MQRTYFENNPFILSFFKHFMIPRTQHFIFWSFFADGDGSTECNRLLSLVGMTKYEQYEILFLSHIEDILQELRGKLSCDNILE
mmetsp:Transcript_33590/g.33857  ORF Transcript_33590/g.33857 Transcript_33590/m.33857 type:complete len:84 (+) Transcript_33590:1218-1469(+)